MWAGVVATMVAVLFGGAQAQQGVPNNITTLAGTWTTGSGAVVTGLVSTATIEAAMTMAATTMWAPDANTLISPPHS